MTVRHVQHATTTQRRPRQRCRAGPSRARGSDERRFDAFMSDQTSGVHQTGTDIVRLQPGVARKDDVGRVAGGQHAEHVLNRETAVPDDRLAAENVGIRSDSAKELYFDASMSHGAPQHHATSVSMGASQVRPAATCAPRRTDPLSQRRFASCTGSPSGRYSRASGISSAVTRSPSRT